MPKTKNKATGKTVKVNLAVLHKRASGYKSDISLEQVKLKPLAEQAAIIKAKVDTLQKAGVTLSSDNIEQIQQQFSEVENEFVKLDKQVQSLNKKITTIEKNFIEKLKTPLSKAFEVKKGQEVFKTETEAFSKFLDGALAESKKMINELLETTIWAKLTLEQIEHSVNTWALPNTLEKLVKMYERFIQQAEATCGQTLQMSNKALPKGFNPKPVNDIFQTLFSAHKKGGTLLDQIQQNLQNPFGISKTAEDEKANSNSKNGNGFDAKNN